MSAIPHLATLVIRCFYRKAAIWFYHVNLSEVPNSGHSGVWDHVYRQARAELTITQLVLSRQAFTCPTWHWNRPLLSLRVPDVA